MGTTINSVTWRTGRYGSREQQRWSNGPVGASLVGAQATTRVPLRRCAIITNKTIGGPSWAPRVPGMSSDKGNHKGCPYGNTLAQGIYYDERLEVECRGLEKAVYSLRLPN